MFHFPKSDMKTHSALEPLEVLVEPRSAAVEQVAAPVVSPVGTFRIDS